MEAFKDESRASCRDIEIMAVWLDHLSLRSLMYACKRGYNWRQARRLFFEMEHVHKVKPNAYTYTTLLGAMERSAQWKLVLHFYNQMKENNIFIGPIAFR